VASSHGKSALSALALLLVWAGASSPSAAEAQERDMFGGAQPSETAGQIADWVAASGDNRGLPYMIIDKVAAQVFVFGPDGQLRGATPALLGVARGDHSAPGVGDMALSAIPVEDRTTPAGRFVAAYGPAIGSPDVLWVDYATAVSLHPVVTTNRKERRMERLQSPTPDDNRITFGCINVAAAFYDEVVHPAFTGTKSVIYVLPEVAPLDEVFPSLHARLGSRAHGGSQR